MNPVQEKERVFTFYSNLKSELGNAELKFDFKESEFRKLSNQQEGKNQMLVCQYEILCLVDRLREIIEKSSGKPTYISEFSIYEEPPKK